MCFTVFHALEEDGKSRESRCSPPIQVTKYYFLCASAACAERYSGRTFWTTAPYPSNCMAYDPTDNFPPFMSFTIKFDEAEAYRKAIGCYLRKNQWEDITVDVYL